LDALLQRGGTGERPVALTGKLVDPLINLIAVVTAAHEFEERGA
jgi:hypothetical protein